MNKKLLFTILLVATLVCLFAVGVSAAAPAPSKPDLGVEFGQVQAVDLTPPSELYLGTTERVLLVDENGEYATYYTYTVTKNSTTFDFDFSKLNAASGKSYSKKSVVMVEIPNGVTAIPNSYFAGSGNFPLCVSVQVPGTVTSYGSSLFQTNNVIRAIEFLDGTEPVTMGDAMFGSNWSTGTTNLEYVRLPNNLVSIGKNAFGKSHATKTIILGASLKSVGAGFFGESTPDNKDTFVYVPESFFADTDIPQNLFGGYDQYHNNVLKLTIFFTGSQADAEKLVAKGAKVQSGYVWSNVKYVSAGEYIYDTHKNTTRNSITLVYGYSACDVFYDDHAFSGEISAYVDDYFDAISICDICTQCGEKLVSGEIAPIFEWMGYSACLFGDTYSITQGYYVNQSSVEAYKKYVPDFDYSVLATVNSSGAECAPKPGDAGVLSSPFIKNGNEYIDVKVSGIPKDKGDAIVIFCIYIERDNIIYYLDGGKTSEAVIGISYNSVIENTL